MLELIEECPPLARAIALYKTEFRNILFQIQMDSTTQENLKEIAPVVLAMKNTHLIFEDVIVFGESLIQKEEKAKNKE